MLWSSGTSQGLWELADLLWTTVILYLCDNRSIHKNHENLHQVKFSYNTVVCKHMHTNTLHIHTIKDWFQHLPMHELNLTESEGMLWSDAEMITMDFLRVQEHYWPLQCTTIIYAIAARLKRQLFSFWGLTVWVSCHCSGAWELLLSACMDYVLGYSDYGFSSSKLKHIRLLS